MHCTVFKGAKSGVFVHCIKSAQYAFVFESISCRESKVSRARSTSRCDTR